MGEPLSQMGEALPWQSALWQDLQTQVQRQRLPHALLLEGPQGLGKQQLALRLANGLLCQAAGPSVCGRCPACLLMAGGNHPDLRLLQPEKSRQIRIEQVREAIGFITQSAQQGGYKVVIIDPAEAMNRNTANALLKVLEEPPTSSLLILVSHQAGRLLPTLRSRCRRLTLGRAGEAEALPWLAAHLGDASQAGTMLALANGAPLRALALAGEEGMSARRSLLLALSRLGSQQQSVVDAAQDCSALNLEDLLENMLLICSDLLRWQQGGGEQALRDPALRDLAMQLGQGRPLSQALHHYYKQVSEARRILFSGSNPNPLLLLEHLFHTWCRLCRLAR